MILEFQECREVLLSLVVVDVSLEGAVSWVEGGCGPAPPGGFGMPDPDRMQHPGDNYFS